MFGVNPNPEELSVVDLFCGAGGTSLGFQRAGFQLLLGLDTDTPSLETYKSNLCCPAAEADLSCVDGDMIKQIIGRKKIDVIIGCPPCQGYSSLGKSKGSDDDPRNRLVESFGELVRSINPSFLTFENVPGVVGGNHYKTMCKILSDSGYYLNTWLIDMKNYGIPQNRKRIVTVGCNDPKMWNLFTFPKISHSKNGVSGLSPFVTVKDTISDYPPLKQGEEDASLANHSCMGHSERILERIMMIPKDGGSLSDAPANYHYSCHTGDKRGYKDVFGRMCWDAPSPTITTGCGNPTKGRFLHPNQNRAISLREAASLQTFPDDFIFHGNKGSVMRQIGNAFPPRFAELLANKIRHAIVRSDIES